MKRDVQFVRAIDVPYAMVRDQIRDAPDSLFGGNAEPLVTPLTAHLRGTKVTREVTVEIVGFDEPDGAAAGAHLTFRADASKHPDLFPHLEARLDAAPVTDDRTALFLVATYKPPLGTVGGAIDALGLHRFAADSLEGLFDRIVAALED